MSRLAVLGAGGFIGLSLVASLLARRTAEVVPVLRAPAGCPALARFALEGRVADARDAGALRTAFHGCDVVVHAAAGDRSLVVGSIEPVYRAAAEAGVSRLVYLSSLVVHGYDPPAGTTEESPLSRKQEIAYCNWKVDAEMRLGRLRRSSGPEVVILRPGIVLGPRSRWVQDFATALTEGRAYVIGDGTGVCPSIQVDNLIHAIERAAVQPGVDGEAFIVGDRERVTWKQVYTPIVDAMGRSWEGDVHRVPGVPGPSAVGRALEDVRRAAPVEAVRDRLPPRWRAAAFAVLDRLRAGSGAGSPAEAAPPSPASATREMTLLQSCRHKLGHDKAVRLLGYNPPLSFDEGMARSLQWLADAGYLPMEGAR